MIHGALVLLLALTQPALRGSYPQLDGTFEDRWAMILDGREFGGPEDQPLLDEEQRRLYEDLRDSGGPRELLVAVARDLVARVEPRLAESEAGEAAEIWRTAARAASTGKRDRLYWWAMDRYRIAGQLLDALSVTEEALGLERAKPAYAHAFLTRNADFNYQVGRAEAAHASIDALEAQAAVERADGEPGVDEVLLVEAKAVRARLYADAHHHEQAQEEAEEALQWATRLEGLPNPTPHLLDNTRRSLTDVYARTNAPRKNLEVLDQFLSETERLDGKPDVRSVFLVTRALAALQLLPEVIPGSEPRVLLQEALEQASTAEMRARARIYLAILEIREGRYTAAKELLAAIEPRAVRGEGVLADENEIGYHAFTAHCDRMLDLPRDEVLGHLPELHRLIAELWQARGLARSFEQGVGLLPYIGELELFDELVRYEMLAADGLPGIAAGVEHVIDFQDHGALAQRMKLTRGGGLEEVMRELPRGHGVLLYLPPVTTESLVVALDREGVVVGSVASEFELKDVRRRFVASLQRGIADTARRTGMPSAERKKLAASQARQVRDQKRMGAALSKMLLPPEISERVLGWTKMSLVGADSLGYVPFEWLPLGEEPYLGAHRAIDAWPSFSVWRELRARKTSTSLDYLLVSDVQPAKELRKQDAKLTPVVLAAEDRRSLVEPFGEAARFLGGAQVSPRHLGQALAGGCRLLQVIGHGQVDPRLSRPAGLVLQPDFDGSDGVLRAGAIEVMDADIGLVLLSTCASGFAPVVRGDPHSNDLAGAWLTAGARAVLVSHTPLTLGDVLQFSPPFLEALRAGASPAEALRIDRAKLERDYGDAAPHQRGLLQLVGDAQRAIFEVQGDPDPGTSPAAEDD